MKTSIKPRYKRGATGGAGAASDRSDIFEDDEKGIELIKESLRYQQQDNTKSENPEDESEPLGGAEEIKSTIKEKGSASSSSSPNAEVEESGDEEMAGEKAASSSEKNGSG